MREESPGRSGNARPVSRNKLAKTKLLRTNESHGILGLSVRRYASICNVAAKKELKRERLHDVSGPGHRIANVEVNTGMFPTFC